MKKELSITKQNIFVKQAGANECWYACYLMVRQYMESTKLDYVREKNTILNSQIFNSLKNAYKDGADPNQKINVNPFRDGAGDDFLIGILQEQGHQFVMHTVTAWNVSEMANLIEGNFNHKKPVILGFNRGVSSGHFVFVYGISFEASTGWELTYLDPQADINNCVRTVSLSHPSIASILT